MCNQWCLAFGRSLKPKLPQRARVLDVGSRDVNGSMREVFADIASAYVGVDIEAGPGVDVVGDVVDLGELVGWNAFDLVMSTEMIEHCEPWRDAVSAMVASVRVGGYVLITTRSPGFALHGYPSDHWRYTRADMRRILGPVCEIIDVQSDPTLGWACGVGVLARRTATDEELPAWRASLDHIELYKVTPGVDIEGTHRVELAEPLDDDAGKDAGSPGEPIWDQVSRYSGVAQAIRANAGERAVRVLDVGSGEPRLLRSLLPGCEVWCMDPLLEGEGGADERVIAGRLGETVIQSGSFDWVVCVDTLEHVAPGERASFLKSLAAVPKSGLVIAGPLADGGGAKAADEAIDAIFEARHGHAYPWLAEHREYGLPSRSEIVSALEGAGFSHAEFGNGRLDWHRDLLSVTLLLMEHPSGRSPLERLSRFFGEHLAAMDHAEPTYRRVIVATRGSAPVAPSLPQVSEADLVRGDERLRVAICGAIDDLAGAVDESTRQRLSAELALKNAKAGEANWRRAHSEVREQFLEAVARQQEALVKLRADWGERVRTIEAQREEAIRLTKEAHQKQAALQRELHAERADREKALAEARARLDESNAAHGGTIEALRSEVAAQRAEVAQMGERLAEAERAHVATVRTLEATRARELAQRDRVIRQLQAHARASDAAIEEMQRSTAVRVGRRVGQVKRGLIGLVRSPKATGSALVERTGKLAKRTLPMSPEMQWKAERVFFTCFGSLLRATPAYATHQMERSRRAGTLPQPPAGSVEIKPARGEASSNGRASVVEAVRPETAVVGLDTDQPAVIVFGIIDWHFRHQRPQHLAAALARKGHRVFYVSPRFVARQRGGSDDEVIDVGGGAVVHHTRLWVKGVPRIYHGMPSEEQQAIMVAGLRRMLLEHRIGRTICKIDHPGWVWLAKHVPDGSLVYDCMDHHAGFENTGGEVAQLEDELLAIADLTLVTSGYLEEIIAPRVPQHAMVRNACDPDHFATRPAEVWQDPEGRPVVGYLGAIAEWFDAELIDKAAEARPDVCFLLVGGDSAGNKGKLSHRKNVVFVGEIPYAEAGKYVHAMDVCTIPFQITELIKATNPVKVYEYLASGKPVVTTDLPELREPEIDGLIHRAESHEAFIEAIDAALADKGDRELAARREAFAREQTWAHRAASVDAALEKMSDPLASVVVVTWNNLALTKACLESVLSEPSYTNIELIVVDNASTDETPAYLAELAERDSRVRVLLQTQNLGFAGGNNVGLAAARGAYICLLNNDTVVTRGWLRTLINHARRDPTIGLIGPVTNNIGNEARVETSYKAMDEMHAQAFVMTRSEAGGTRPLAAAAFFCVLARAAVWREVGVIDESYERGYFEDDDYCRRILAAGYRIVCAEDVFIHHHLAASFGSLGQEERNRLLQVNRQVFEAKWGAWQPHRYRGADEHPPLTLEAARQRL
ncbi:MAG: glycosyltransferase [Phycisphaerales bacterium]|nr:MAG: glycosyltransferase [Phycisphaerales bacterium]